MSEPGLWMRWAKVWAAGGAIVGLGAVLFEYTVPTKEQLVAQLSPELREQYERERGLRQAEQQELMKIVQETMKSKDPIWKTGAIKSPWERSSIADSGKTDSDQYKETDHFHKLRSEMKQKQDLESISKQLEEIRIKSEQRTREILEEKRKNSEWYKFW